MKIIKKLMAFLLAVLIMLASLGVMADETESIVIDVDLSEFVGNWDTLKSGYKTVRFNIPEDGIYAITADISNASSLQQSRDFYTDSTERTKIMTVSVSCSELDRNGYGPWYNDSLLATWEFTEGENIIYMVNGDRFRMRNLRLKKLNKAVLESAEIGSELYAEGESYARGTDNISLVFDGDIESVDPEGITLLDSDGEEIDTVSQIDENNSKRVIISFKDTLGYNKTYTLTVSGIEDSIGYKLDDAQLTFLSSDESSEDTGADTASIESLTVKDDIATVKGTVVGSTGVGICGRKIDLYLTLPEQSQILAASTISQDNGAYEITYEINDVDTAGNILAEIQAEYATDRVSDTCYYVSAESLIPIFGALSETTQGAGVDTPGSVEYLLKQNMTNLGINPDTDLEEAGITAHSQFYNILVGANADSLDQFHELYRFAIALQTINEVTDASVIESMIQNQDTNVILGLDEEKINALNADGIEKLCEEMLDFEILSKKEDFLLCFEQAFNNALIAQEGLGDITLTALSAVSARRGAEVKLDIKSTNIYSGIKEFVLDLSFGGALKNGITDVEFITDLGTCETNITTDSAEMRIIVSDDAIPTEEIAKLSFTCSSVGSGTVAVKGFAIASTGTDYDANLTVNDILYSVTINAQVTNNIGGGSGGGFGGGSSGKGSFVSGSTAIPAVSVPKETEASARKFVDLIDAPWAEEAILGLYNRQAITMTEDMMFYPNREITRAEFIKMVVLANDMYMSSLVNVDFSDVSENDWYYQYVNAAVNFNLIQGDGNGAFRPDELISREDICVILSRVKSFEEVEVKEPFADDSVISDYAHASVYAMKESGIVNGIGDNLFAPKDNATRAMAAKIIYGFIK